MKQSRLLLLMSVLINLLLAELVVQIFVRTNADISSVAAPFEIVKQTNGYMIGLQNARYYWSVETNLMSMNIGPDQSATFNFNPTNDRIESIVLELISKDGTEKYYVSDFNADGIPDRKEIKGSWEKQIFYHGRFLTLFATNGNQQCIVEDGKLRTVRFSGDGWEEIKGSSLQSN